MIHVKLNYWKITINETRHPNTEIPPVKINQIHKMPANQSRVTSIVHKNDDYTDLRIPM